MLWGNAFNNQVTAWQLDEYGSLLEVFFGKISDSSVWQMNIPGKRESSSEFGAKADFNGDGLADVFLHNTFTGELAAWLTDGTKVFQNISYGQVDPNTKWFPISFGDFNGDSRTDLLWYNIESGDIIAWLINGSTILQQTYYGAVLPASGWTLSAINDFNADGRSDLLWYNFKSGEVIAWLLYSDGIIAVPSYGISPPTSGWRLMGVDDFNGDNCADLLWHNAYSGELRVWFLSGSGYLGYTSYGIVLPNMGWTLMGIGDFNGDTCTDLLWYNIFDGNVFAQLLNVYGVISEPYYGTVLLDSGWALINIDDFNGDYRSDLLWYNKYNGEVLTWSINGNDNLGFTLYGTVAPDSGWVLTGLDDFNGDGRSDLLWRNIYTNQTKSWLIYGGGVFLEFAYENIESSSVWQLFIP